jgi:hypothetical protein
MRIFIFSSPFEKGGLMGIYLIMSYLTAFFKEGELDNYTLRKSPPPAKLKLKRYRD